jgi:hypothetical protein
MTEKPKRPRKLKPGVVPRQEDMAGAWAWLIDPDDPIYGELVAPCRCVYPHCCFCTEDQKAGRTV